MHSLETLINRAKQVCVDHGSRLTEKRELVLTILLHSNKAMSAYDIVDKCKDDFNHPLSPMSVYRILEFLESRHLVHKINIANKFVACTHMAHQTSSNVSQFIFCSQCEKVDEIDLQDSKSAVLQNNATNMGYKPITTHIELNCICHDCQSAPA